MKANRRALIGYGVFLGAMTAAIVAIWKGKSNNKGTKHAEN